MKRFVLIPNAVKDVDFSVTEMVVGMLSDMGAEIYVGADCAYATNKVRVYTDFPKDVDLIIIVGGDGSVIDAAKYAVANDVPILGINLGKVGYLAEVEVNNLSVLSRLFSGEYLISSNMLLEVEYGSNGEIVNKFAVNDVLISRDGYQGIADIKIEDSIKNQVKYRADGVILSTPQGSTAYSLSAGGPILAHDVESILMTPVSSHSFFNRSVLFNSSEVIRVTNAGDIPLVISVDGRKLGELTKDQSCAVRKSFKTIKMLTFAKNSMFTSLFRKMRILGDMD